MRQKPLPDPFHKRLREQKTGIKNMGRRKSKDTRFEYAHALSCES